MAEHFPKASLVVIEPLLRLIIDGADVHDYIASVEDSWVPGTFDVCYTASVERHVTFSVKGATCIAIGLREP